MLSLGLEEARKMDIEKVLISAHADNIASWKTIE
jgi:predicted acetyltransferase